jgi:hypothetical protein
MTKAGIYKCVAIAHLAVDGIKLLGPVTECNDLSGAHKCEVLQQDSNTDRHIAGLGMGAGGGVAEASTQCLK